MNQEIKKGPYVVEVNDFQTVNVKTWEEDNEYPYVVSEEVISFRYWEDAVDYMFGRPYRKRDGYASIFEDDNDIVRSEVDEGGYTTFVLHKWQGIESCLNVEWTITNGSEKTVVNSNEDRDRILQDYLGEGATFVWKDGWVGKLGWAADKYNNIYHSIIVQCGSKWIFGKDYSEKMKAVEEKRNGRGIKN